MKGIKPIATPKQSYPQLRKPDWSIYESDKSLTQKRKVSLSPTLKSAQSKTILNRPHQGQKITALDQTRNILHVASRPLSRIDQQTPSQSFIQFKPTFGETSDNSTDLKSQKNTSLLEVFNQKKIQHSVASPVRSETNKRSNNVGRSPSFSQMAQSPTQGPLQQSSARYNVIRFYQQLLKQLEKSDKMQVLCSHLLTRLNSSLNQQNGHENMQGFRELLKGIAYFKGFESQVENGSTIESQSRSAQQYCSLASKLGCKDAISLSDIHNGNVEQQVKHLLSMSNCLLTDQNFTQLSTDWDFNDQDFFKVKQDVFPLSQVLVRGQKSKESLKEAVDTLSNEKHALSQDNQCLQLKVREISNLLSEAKDKLIVAQKSLQHQPPKPSQTVQTPLQTPANTDKELKAKLDQATKQINQLTANQSEMTREFNVKQQVINEFISHLKQDHEEERLRMEQAISLLLQKCKASNLSLDALGMQQLFETQSGEQSDQLKRDYEVVVQNLKICETKLDEQNSQNHQLKTKVSKLQQINQTIEKDLAATQKQVESDLKSLQEENSMLRDAVENSKQTNQLTEEMEKQMDALKLQKNTEIDALNEAQSEQQRRSELQIQTLNKKILELDQKGKKLAEVEKEVSQLKEQNQELATLNKRIQDLETEAKTVKMDKTMADQLGQQLKIKLEKQISETEAKIKDEREASGKANLMKQDLEVQLKKIVDEKKLLSDQKLEKEQELQTQVKKLQKMEQSVKSMQETMDEVEQEKQEEINALQKVKQELSDRLEAALKDKLKLQAETIEKSLLDAIQAKLAETVASSVKKAQQDAERIEGLTKSATEMTQEVEKLKLSASELTDQLSKTAAELLKAKEDLVAQSQSKPIESETQSTVVLLDEKENEITALAVKVANMTEELKEMDKKIAAAHQNETLMEKYKKQAETNSGARQVAEQQASKATFEMRQLLQKIGGFEDEIHALEDKNSELEAQIETLKLGQVVEVKVELKRGQTLENLVKQESSQLNFLKEVVDSSESEAGEAVDIFKKKDPAEQSKAEDVSKAEGALLAAKMHRAVTLVPRGPNGELPGEYDSEEGNDSDSD